MTPFANAAQEARRVDPDRIAACGELHASWIDARNVAHQKLREALDALRQVPLDYRDPTARMLADSRRLTVHALHSIERVGTEPASETLLGNMAAAGMPDLPISRTQD